MKLPLYLFLMFVSLPIQGASTRQPVRSFLSNQTQSSSIVGQKVTVIVNVYVDTHFSGSTRFTLPDISGAVFYKPEERAIVGSQEIGGVTYTSQRHEFAFYPQRAGTFTIPPFTVRYGIAGKIGENPTEHSDQTQPIEITAVMPPGAENLHSLIATTDLKVSETWSPAIQSTYTAGNALKRHITFRAPDVPGMVFPAVNTPQIDGLKLYRARATIHDKINRGSLIGERAETLTYVCQEPGQYTLPAVNIHWWDLDQKTIKVITLPAVVFEVTPAPNANKTPDNKQNEPALSKTIVFSAIIILLGAVFLIYKFRPPLQQRYTNWKHHRQESESAYFKKITPDLSPADTLNAINQWLAHIRKPHSTLTDWAASHNNPSLTQHIEELQRAIVSTNPTWNSTPLIAALKKTRSKNILSTKAKATHLPPLNPK